jgi:outer membrane receptor protein involved in Fe transport
MQSSSLHTNRTAGTPAVRNLLTLVMLSMASLIAATTKAQTPTQATVSGRVRDAAGKPVEFATVLLVRAADSLLVKGAITDADGSYLIETTKEGTFRVNATQVGYQKVYTPPFEIKGGQLTHEMPPLTIAENTKMLGEVKVTAAKPFIEQLPDKTVVNVESSVVASGGTALDVLERSPGVTVDTQNERISLKGRDGVLVMIDGKPTYLSMTEVVNLLRNTPSNSVQTIELITNPSAKYDAAGNSGIINIRLKRGTVATDGTNGSATLGAGQGRFPKTSAGLTINHRHKNLSLFGNYNYDYRQGYGSVDARRQFGAGDSLTTVRSLGYRPSTNKGHTFKAGADYTLGKSTTVGVMVNGLLSSDRAQIDNRNLVSNARGQLLETVTMINASTRSLQRGAANANLKHTFDTLGRELTVDADFSRVTIDPQDNMRTRYFNAAGEETRPDLVQRNTPPSTVTIRAAKADYTHPLSKQTKLEAGGKISYVTSDNDVVFETLTEGQYVPDPQRTNHFLYDETIAAGYLNGSHNWQKWSVQAGVRLEHTRSLGNSVTLNKIVDRRYTNLFPSVFLTYTASKDHQWRTSYSRRIDRPNYQELNPFIYVMDPYTYREGNPFLRPQYTNAFQLGYTYKGGTTVTLSYNHTTDVITGVNDQSGQVLRVTTVNLAALKNVNLSVDYPLTLAKWWTVRPSVNVFMNAYNASYAGAPLDYRQVSANVNMNQNFTLPRGFTAELTGFYNSPLVYGMLRTTGFGQVSAGVQKHLWNKTATLRLNVSDIFWTMRPGGTIRHATTNLQFANRFESRVARLTFTYNLGNQKLKTIRQRRTGVEDEQERVGN